jgi:hypothetical protein
LRDRNRPNYKNTALHISTIMTQSKSSFDLSIQLKIFPLFIFYG